MTSWSRLPTGLYCEQEINLLCSVNEIYVLICTAASATLTNGQILFSTLPPAAMQVWHVIAQSGAGPGGG